MVTAKQARSGRKKRSQARKRGWGARRIIAQLLKSGWTKWQIKKALHCSWSTVHRWGEGDLRPTVYNLSRLHNLLKQPVPKSEAERNEPVPQL